MVGDVLVNIFNTPVFSEKDCIFMHVTGGQNGHQEEQLNAFILGFSWAFYPGARLETPSSWERAFMMLNEAIEKTDKKVVIFLDELPWLATRKSTLLSTITQYWNSIWAGNPRVIFVACGSSASRILKKIIYNNGGLYNRTTLDINLLPFKLWEVRDFLHSKDVHLNDKHILSLYMALGGIPYYLNYVVPDQTAQQAIQSLFFDDNAPLKNEYNKLFASLFDDVEVYRTILETLAGVKKGATRGELETAIHPIASGGSNLTRKLRDLSDAGFIKAYIPWKKNIGRYYKVIDEFCLFHIRWIQNYKGDSFDRDYWVIQSQKPAYHAWAGYAFEAVCSKHIHQIIRSLGIVAAQIISSWQHVARGNREKGAQIDLVIERADDAITLCEIKYTDSPFEVTKSYAEAIERKMAVFKKQTKTTSQLFFALVSASGIKNTMYSEALISGVATLEDLYKHE